MDCVHPPPLHHISVPARQPMPDRDVRLDCVHLTVEGRVTVRLEQTKPRDADVGVAGQELCEYKTHAAHKSSINIELYSI